MQIFGFNKTTLLDYPNHLASTVFIGGCNFRCSFCHNASLVIPSDANYIISEDEVFKHLRKRAGIIEGVCITGGEPTLQNDLPVFISKVKEIGLKVKLDTNGSNPIMLKNLIHSNMIDYVAMDIKNSKDKYNLTIESTELIIDKITESIKIIMNSDINYEFRTTIVKELHEKQDIINIGKWIKGATNYYIQSYKDSENVIKEGYTSYSLEKLKEFKELIEPFVIKAEIRGV